MRLATDTIRPADDDSPLWRGLGLPDPEPMAINLARCSIEAMAGVREPEQLARWVDDAVYQRILHRIVLATRARAVTRRPPDRPIISIGTVRLYEPRAGIVEATVIVHTRTRVRAVALRIEAVGTRWRASVLGIL
ncbi:Rv3235 family protein [Cryobacterium sp. MLB-32]|uniref:Rv3235 family protein n=1 Tax=Cryobacterium sp. MLB-32 TaxID=1529318 RepID=UPI000690DA5E|nr:Rv3235 family protein [Cryobacterium sp. MLB-32]